MPTRTHVGNQPVHTCLETNNFRQRHPEYCFGLPNTLTLHSSSKTYSSYKMFSSKQTLDRQGDQTSTQHKCNKSCKSPPRRFLQSSLSHTKKGGKVEASHRSVLFKPFHSKLSFSDGKYFLSKINHSKGRLHDKCRLKGRLPISFYSPNITKVPHVQMGKHVLCLPEPPVWAKYSTKGIHKTLKTGSVVSPQKECSNDCVSGRFSPPSSQQNRGKSEHIHDNTTSPRSRPQHKLGKIVPCTKSDYYLSRFQHKLSFHDSNPSRRQNSVNTVSLRKGSVQPSHDSTGSSQHTRYTRVNTPCFTSGPFTFPTFTNSTDQTPSNQRARLQHTINSKSQCSSGIGVVDSKSQKSKWQSNHLPTTRHGYHNRRLQGRLGCNLRRSHYQRSLVRARKTIAHKLSRAKSCLPSIKVIYEKPVQKGSFPQNGQLHSSCLHQQQRGNSIPKPGKPDIRDLAMVPREKHNNKCSTSARQRQHCGRQGVEGVLRHKRMATKSTSNLPVYQRLRHRPVCLPADNPASPVCELASRSGSYIYGRHDNILGPAASLCLSPVCHDTGSITKGKARSSRHYSSGSSMASSTMVANPSAHACQEADVTTSLKEPSERPIITQEDTPNVSQASSSRISYIRKNFETEGIPDNVTNILLSATRSSTSKTYQSAWKHWSSWCNSKQVNPVSATLNNILLFLTEFFEGGAAYRSVNVVRSAISSSHVRIDGHLVGQHPLVVQLLKGMVNIRPPVPKYSHTWDVAQVTKYLSSLGNSTSLSLKQLSEKLAMLFALSCPERVSSLSRLDLRFCRLLPEGISFTLTTPRKRGSPDEIATAFFASFPSNKKLCPKSTLQHYLQRTKKYRTIIPPSEPDLVFVSYVKPHKPITSSTLSRWLRETIKEAGINTDIFKAHSVRGASTTAAANKNVPLKDILTMADWSSASTFQKFYYKPVFKANYGQAVLSK